jgi:hypothetical protein
MSTLAVNAVTDANGGNTATINSMTLQQRFLK